MISYRLNVKPPPPPKAQSEVLYCQHCGFPAHYDLVVDDRNHVVFMNGVELHLPPTSWALFIKLYRNFGWLVPNDELVDELKTSDNMNSVRVNISHLRRALHMIRCPWMIMSIDRLGYRMNVAGVPIVQANTPDSRQWIIG